MAEIQRAITKSKQQSSPGPFDQIPYCIFKQCLSLTTALVDLFSLCWRQRRVPMRWKHGAIHLISKATAKIIRTLHPTSGQLPSLLVWASYLPHSCHRKWRPCILVTRKQKLQLYKAGTCPRLSWDLGVTTLPLSWVKTTPEAKVTKYLKKWSGLARSADPAWLYLPRKDGGLQLPSLLVHYEKLKCSQATLLLTSQDGVTCLVTSHQTQREEETERTRFRPFILTRDSMAQDPGVSRRVLERRVKLL